MGVNAEDCFESCVYVCEFVFANPSQTIVDYEAGFLNGMVVVAARLIRERRHFLILYSLYYIFAMAATMATMHKKS